MRFQVTLLATLIAGAFSSYLEKEDDVDKAFYDIITRKFRLEADALKLDDLQLPDLEFSVAATEEQFPKREVTLRQGQVQGLSTVVRPRGRCWGDAETGFTCHVTFDGLRILYEATASDPGETFSVEVYAEHSLVDVNIAKGVEHYELKDVKLRSVFFWIRRPVEFTNDVPQNVVFENELRLKLHEVLKEGTLVEAVKEALAKAVTSESF